MASLPKGAIVISYYAGVYWKARKEELPEDWTVCVYHLKWRKPNDLCFGKFWQGYFYEKCGKERKSSDVDYWMPIPVLPES